MGFHSVLIAKVLQGQVKQTLNEWLPECLYYLTLRMRIIAALVYPPAKLRNGVNQAVQR